jgi:hypothetical protein
MPGSGRTLTGLYTNKGERQRDFGRITGKPELMAADTIRAILLTVGRPSGSYRIVVRSF